MAVKPNTYVGFLDHGDIISSVTDRRCDYLIVILHDQADNLSLLTRRNSTANHSVTGLSDLSECHPEHHIR